MHILSPQSYSSGSSCLDTLFDGTHNHYLFLIKLIAITIVSYHNKCTSFSNTEYIYSGTYIYYLHLISVTNHFLLKKKITNL